MWWNIVDRLMLYLHMFPAAFSVPMRLRKEAARMVDVHG